MEQRSIGQPNWAGVYEFELLEQLLYVEDCPCGHIHLVDEDCIEDDFCTDHRCCIQ